MVVLDACVLIANFENDVHATKAANVLDTEDALTLHPLTLSECAVGASRTRRLDVLRGNIQRLGADVWQPDPEHWFRVGALRAATGLSLPDCCVLEAARTLVASLATFDLQLAKAAKSMGIPVDDGS